jgi:hypothetical protein
VLGSTPLRTELGMVLANMAHVQVGQRLLERSTVGGPTALRMWSVSRIEVQSVCVGSKCSQCRRRCRATLALPCLALPCLALP